MSHVTTTPSQGRRRWDFTANNPSPHPALPTSPLQWGMPRPPFAPGRCQGSPVHPVMHLDMPSVILLEKWWKCPLGQTWATPSLQSHTTAEEKAFGKDGIGRWLDVCSDRGSTLSVTSGHCPGQAVHLQKYHSQICPPQEITACPAWAAILPSTLSLHWISGLFLGWIIRELVT